MKEKIEDKGWAYSLGKLFSFLERKRQKP